MNNSVGDKYYNEELKKRYLKERQKELSISVNYIDTLFRKAYENENELDKDLSNWTAYEIQEYYKLQNVASLESLKQTNSVFSKYTQFCLENNLVIDNQNHYLEFNEDILTTCVSRAILNKKIIDRETVLNWVNQLPNPKDQFILLSLFEYGKSKDFIDIVSVKQKDINGNELKLSNRTVRISHELVNIIKKCYEENEYFSITGKGEKVFPLIDRGYIVKSFPNQNKEVSDFQKGRNIYISCQRIFDYLGVRQWMSPNAVSESGKLYMIKCRAGERNMSPIDYINSTYINEVEQQFDFAMPKSTFIKKYKEILNA